MHTLYDQHTRREIIQRLERLKADATPEWGKMDVTGMLTHCSLGLQMARGLIRPRRTLMGRLLGPFFPQTIFQRATIRQECTHRR
jgi:hypothetical protein